MAEKSFLGKAGPLVLARFITAILTIAIPLVLARALALEEYGTYKQLFLLAQTLTYILPLGVGQSLYYFLPRSDAKRTYLGQTLLFLTAMGAVAAAGIWHGADSIGAWFSNPALAEFKGALALYTFATVGSFALETTLTSQGKTKQSALVYLACDTTRAVAMVAPILLEFDLHGAMNAMAAFGVARYVAAAVVMLRTGTGKLWDTRQFVTQFAYAFPFGAAMVLAISQQYAHQFVVSSSVTPELFALYAVGCFQLPIVDLLYTPTSEVLMVRLGELDKQGRVHEGVATFREAAAKLSVVFFPISAFLFAAAPEFIGALFGQKFLGAVPIFRIGVIGIVFAIFPMDGVLRARGETKHIFNSYLVKAIVTVPMVIFGVKWFGMIGGIGSWAIAELVGKAVLMARVPKALSSPAHAVTFNALIPWRDLGKASAAAALAASSVVVLRWFVPQAALHLPDDFLWRVIPLGVAGILFSAGYVVALRAAGIRVEAVLQSFRGR